MLICEIKLTGLVEALYLWMKPGFKCRNSDFVFNRVVDSLFLQFLQLIPLLTNSGFGKEMYIIFAQYYHLSPPHLTPILLGNDRTRFRNRKTNSLMYSLG